MKEKMGNYKNEIKKERSYEQTSVLECDQENGRWVTNTPSGGEGVAGLALSESCKFSNIALVRSEAGYARKLMQYEGNRFVLIAK